MTFTLFELLHTFSRTLGLGEAKTEATGPKGRDKVEVVEEWAYSSPSARESGGAL